MDDVRTLGCANPQRGSIRKLWTGWPVASFRRTVVAHGLARARLCPRECHLVADRFLPPEATTLKPYHHRVVQSVLAFEQPLEAAAEKKRGPWAAVALTELGKPWGDYGLNQAQTRSEASGLGWLDVPGPPTLLRDGALPERRICASNSNARGACGPGDDAALRGP
jgi:hypothetical protein